MAWLLDHRLHCTPKVILHIGPNECEQRYLLRKYPSAQYIGLDIYERPFVNLVADATTLPLSDNSVDLVIAWHVLEHIPDDLSAIKEAYRVCKPNGIFLFSVPIHPVGNLVTQEGNNSTPEQRLLYHGHPDHFRSCGLDYGERAKICGFSTRQIIVENSATSEEKKKFGLSDKHVAWVCIKGTADV